MAKINQEEYEVLKELDDKWKWIAGDEAQQTYVYEYRPIKSKLRGQWESNWNDYYPLPHDWFQFIKWEDEEPYSITELIEEYEKAMKEAVEALYKASSKTVKAMGDAIQNIGKAFSSIISKFTIDDIEPLLNNEGEEIEVKNIEWLKEKIGEITCVDTVFNSGGLSYIDSAVPVMPAYDLINQLDEPETVEQTTHLLESVLRENKRLGKLLEEKHEEWLELMDEINNQETLSEYWIEQKSIDTHVDTVNGEVQVTFRLDDLEKLLVPKQELPVIPKIVAEVIEEHKELGYDVYDSINLIIETNGEGLPSISNWVARNIDKYARAWLDGSTVEEEQKYVVKLPMPKNNDNQYAIVDHSGYIWIDALPSKYKLTEEEIRGLTKGDVLFEHFAVKVEEMEE